MSIAEFSATLRDAAYKSWFKNSSKNILVQTASSLRKEAESAEKTSFFLTTDSLLQIAEKLAGKQLTEDQADNLYADLLGLVDGKKAVLIQEELSGGQKTITGVYFRQIAFESGINNILEKSLSSLKDRVVIEDNGKTRQARVSDFFQRGHVFGIAANVTTQTARNLAKSNVTKEAKDQLLSTLIGVRNRLLKDDLNSSNIKDLKFSLYAKYFKTPYRYLVEMQPKEVNQQSGIETAVFTNALRRYFSPENNAGVISKYFRDNKSKGDQLVQKLIASKGSPSFIDLIAMNLADTIAGKKRKLEYKVPSTKVTDITYKFNTTQHRKNIKSKIVAIDSAIAKVRSIVPPVDTSQVIQSIVNLQALIQARLALRVKENMGTGNSTRLLNYRTGRLAESAEIDRITTSRDGLLSVFYSYMKYPYATFSEGGQQQSPKTRDPKTLISKSIREIGAELTTSRMRAVSL